MGSLGVTGVKRCALPIYGWVTEEMGEKPKGTGKGKRLMVIGRGGGVPVEKKNWYY